MAKLMALAWEYEGVYVFRNGVVCTILRKRNRDRKEVQQQPSWPVRK